MLSEEVYDKIYNTIKNSNQKNVISKFAPMHIAAIKAYGSQSTTIDKVNRITNDIYANKDVSEIKGFIDEQRITINRIKTWLNTKINELPLFENLNLALGEAKFNIEIKPHPVLTVFEPLLSKINITDSKYHWPEKLTNEDIEYIKSFQPIYGGACSDNLDELNAAILQLLTDEFCDSVDVAINERENKVIGMFVKEFLDYQVYTPYNIVALYYTAMTSMTTELEKHHAFLIKLQKILLSVLHDFVVNTPILRGVKAVDTFNYELYYIPGLPLNDEERDELLYTAFNGLIDTLARCETPNAALQINTNIFGDTIDAGIQYSSLPDRLKEYDSSIPSNRKLLQFYIRVNNLSDAAYTDIFVNLIEQYHYFGAGTILLPTLYLNDIKTIKQIVHAIIYNDTTSIEIINENLQRDYISDLVNFDNTDMLIDSLCANWESGYER